MDKYKARVPEVEAVKYDGDNLGKIRESLWVKGCFWQVFEDKEQCLNVRVFDEEVIVPRGDYLVRCRDGFFCGMSAESFERMYWPAEEGEK